MSVQLLSLIALRNDAPLVMLPYLNATAESLPESIAFSTPTLAVTINALWFTSLVLSLAAALFGILAKQWCREYLRWHSVIATARDNVLLRQLRYEAWQRWRVPSYIACIPALLEVALILFLAGLLAFVHTFAVRALSIIVSLVIGSTLFGVFVLTLLPAFNRLCPFQSPTGWAFVRLAASPASLLVTLRLLSVLNYCLKVFGFRRQNLQSLTRRLLASSSAGLLDWRDYDLSVATSSYLCRLATPGLEKAGMCLGVRDGFDGASVDAFRTSVLIRALSWVQHGSTDQKIIGAVSGCLRSLRDPNGPEQPCGPIGRSALMSTMYTFCKADLCNLLDMMRGVFYHISNHGFAINTGLSLDIEARWGPFTDLSRLRLQSPFSAVRDAWEQDPSTLRLCHALAHTQILSLIDDFLSIIDGNLVEKQRLAEAIVLLLCLLRCVPSLGVRRAITESQGSMTTPWARTLEAAYAKLVSHRAAYSMGLISICVELGRMLGPVDFELRQGEHVMTGQYSVPLRMRWY